MTPDATGPRRRIAGALTVVGLTLVALLAAAVALRVSRRVAATLHPPRVTPPASLDSLAPLLPVSLITADHLTLRGWYLPSRNGAAVVLGHGHGAERSQLAFEARALAQRGFGVLLFDWRAHGASDGAVVTWGVAEQRDLESAVDWIVRRPDVHAGRVGALGFSMGAMTVAMVAARDPRLRGVVLEGCYTSLADMIAHDERHYGWWSEHVALATLRRAGIPLDSVRPVDVVARIAPRPLLVVGGARDDDTPPEVARRLYAAAGDPKSLYIVPGAGHTSYAVGGAALAARIGDFFARALDTPAADP